MVLAATGVRRLDSTPRLGGKADVERLASLVAGGVLALYGLKRRDLPGLLLAAGGTALVARGMGMSLQSLRLPIHGSGSRDVDEPSGDEVTGAAATVNARRAIKVEESIVVDAPPERVFTFWRRFENLPTFMAHLESVVELDDRRSHWVARVPGGPAIEWDAELVNEVSGELIAWKTVGNPDVAHAGSVHFSPAAGGGTEVRFVIDYEPPGGRVGGVGAAIARLFGESPDQTVRKDLESLREVLGA
jgi:uncharacterized membrane protein